MGVNVKTGQVELIPIEDVPVKLLLEELVRRGLMRKSGNYYKTSIRLTSFGHPVIMDGEISFLDI